MSKKIVLKKATRIEGNANVEIQVENGRIESARFLVYDFRGFEKFMQGRKAEHIPSIVSRICGLCSAAHQVASFKAIENALGVEVSRAVYLLREIMVLGEWISSHALSYFYLAMPDFVGATGGIFELMQNHPEVAKEAYTLRSDGQQIVKLLGKRATHPISLGIGKFLIPPTADDLKSIRDIALKVKNKTAEMIKNAGQLYIPGSEISFPRDQQINLLSYDGLSNTNRFNVHDQKGNMVDNFTGDEFSDNISEIHVEWSFAKFPYLTRYGFPDGILLVGPLARALLEWGPLNDPEIKKFDLAQRLLDNKVLTLESFDSCRLLEIFWAAKRILTLLEEVSLDNLNTEVDSDASGKGMGVLEAPRGTLMHSYTIKDGCLNKARMLVATQFNNAFINLIIRDLAEKHLEKDQISAKGEWLIGRCIRLFDPCLSCATH